jgi:deoxyadenosine/deoxycytidine kinase
LDTKNILDNWKPTPGKLPVVVTERSVLTDRHVFAEMLHKQGQIDELEWNLYLRWYNAFAKDLPVKGIIHVTTSASTSKERIAIRDRKGEGDIPMEYLEALDAAHQAWVESSHLPTLQISTEPGTDVKDTAERVYEWILTLLEKKD